MKILMAIDDPGNPNLGAAGTIYQVSKALKYLGHEVDNIWEADLPHKIKHGNLHYLLELPRAYVQAIIKRLRAGKQYEVIQISQPHCFLAAKYVRKHLPNTVLIHRSHGLELHQEEVLKPFIEQVRVDKRNYGRKMLSKVLSFLLARHSYLAFKYCDGHIVDSEQDKEFLTERFQVDPERVKVIPEGVTDAFISTPNKVVTPDRHKKLLFIGQFAFFKAPHILADVVNQVLKSKPDVTMTWVCDQKHHNSVRALFDVEVLKRINLLPWMSQEDLIGIYDTHGIFIFPTLFEGTGKVHLEAMARGLCVVSSNAVGPRDSIKNGENGILVKVGVSSGFIDKTLELLEDFVLAERISLEAIATARSCSCEINTKESVEFYKKLLVRKRVMSPNS